MSCPFCGRDVCLCGEAYKNLTEKELTTLFYLIVQKAKETLPELTIKVMGVDLDTWMMNEDIDKDAPKFKSIYADLNALGTLPKPYLRWLEQQKGKSVRDTIKELISDPPDGLLMFPLVMVIYRRYHTRQMKLAERLLSSTLTYLKVKELTIIVQEGVERHQADESDEQRYISNCLRDLWMIKQFPSKPENAAIYHDRSLVKMIQAIMGTINPTVVMTNAVHYLINIAADDEDAVNDLITEYKQNGLSNDLVDNLIDLDGTVVGDIAQVDIETSWIM